MSHFVVWVLHRPEDDLPTLLAPFNEQPDAGDPHVQMEFEDQTEDLLEQYSTSKPKGAWVDGVWVFQHALPENFEGEIIEETFEKIYGSFEDFCEEYHGMRVNKDGRVGYLTNPKAKWDWWQLGGRWSGMLLAQPGVIGEIGERGIGSIQETPDKYYDSMRLDGIDFEGERERLRQQANERYDKFEQITTGLPPVESFAAIRERVSDIDEARAQYHGQPVVQALREHKMISFMSDAVKTFAGGREATVARFIDSHMTPYSILYDGEWLQQGDMGWFGISSNEDADWPTKVWELIKSLPGDTIVSVVDCHI